MDPWCDLGGLLAAGTEVTSGAIALLAGLYVAFIGRILLKDFRDVRGDVYSESALS